MMQGGVRRRLRFWPHVALALLSYALLAFPMVSRYGPRGLALAAGFLFLAWLFLIAPMVPSSVQYELRRQRDRH